MIIQVASELRIVGDGRCWAVERFIPPTEKRIEGRWDNVGWYGRLSQAVHIILERHLQLLDGKSNQVVIGQVDDIICRAAAQLEDVCERVEREALSKLMTAERERDELRAEIAKINKAAEKEGGGEV